MYIVFVFRFLCITQQVAKGKASAFTRCSGFAQVLSGLGGRALTSERPQARKVSAAAKGANAKGLRASAVKRLLAVKAGKMLVKVKAEPGITVLPRTSSASSVLTQGQMSSLRALRLRIQGGLGTEPANPEGDAPPKPLSMSRSCVHSRAYCEAKAEANAQGLGAEAVRELACAAGKVATVQWDIEFK